MDVLVIIAIVVGWIYKMTQQEKKENDSSPQQTVMPPENWPHIPMSGTDQPQTVRTAKAKAAAQKQRAKKTYSQSPADAYHSMAGEGVQSTTKEQVAALQKEAAALQESEAPDYSIHSAEELKKAFVWSEILKRKY